MALALGRAFLYPHINHTTPTALIVNNENTRRGLEVRYFCFLLKTLDKSL